MELTLVVLAAGMGTRFGGTKQVVPVGPYGETILEYSLYDARRAGFSRIVFVIRKEIEEQFRSTVLRRLPSGLHWSLAFQETVSCVPEDKLDLALSRKKPWGTGHALLCAKDAVCPPGSCTSAPGSGSAPGAASAADSAPGCPSVRDISSLAVINADDYYGREAFSRVARHLADTAAAPCEDRYCLAGYRLQGTTSSFGPVSRGVCRTDPEGFLAAIEEHLKIISSGPELRDGFISLGANGSVRERFSGLEPVSMNLWGFPCSLFEETAELFREWLASPESGSEFFLPYVVDSLLRRKRAKVKVLPVEEQLFGLTHPEDLPHARAMLAAMHRKAVYPSPLWPGSSPSGGL